MLAPRPINQTRVVMLSLVLTAAVLGMLWLVLRNFLTVGGGAVPEDVQQSIAKISSQRFPPVPRFNPNPALFSSTQFLQLRQFTDLPVRPGAMGRPNPFLPVPYGGQGESLPAEGTDTGAAPTNPAPGAADNGGPTSNLWP